MAKDRRNTLGYSFDKLCFSALSPLFQFTLITCDHDFKITLVSFYVELYYSSQRDTSDVQEVSKAISTTILFFFFLGLFFFYSFFLLLFILNFFIFYFNKKVKYILYHAYFASLYVAVLKTECLLLCFEYC